jgi:biotin carboxyl carrier protein
MTALHEATGYAPATRELSVPGLPRQRTAGSRHGAPARAARTSTGSHRAVGPSADAIRLIPAPRLPALEELPTVDDLPVPVRRVRRRPSVLLGALVAGGVVAGVLGIHDGFGEPAAATSVLAAQDALLGEDQLEAMPMAAITEAEAQARLDEVAASRQERADARADAEAAAEAARLAAIEAARPKTVLPVDGATLTSGFGSRWGTYHYGIDLAAPMHTPEYAAADGVVLRAGSASGFGLAVYILHESGDVTVYGHMDEILVSPGDYVEAGDTIALLGNTGQSTGPHLHFEVHQGGEGGTKIDPIPWLQERGVDI